MITSSGMAAMSAVALSQLETGDHLVVSDQLYGRTLDLFIGQSPRLGVSCTAIDTCDLEAVKAAVSDKTKLIVVETISNPLLRVADIAALAKIAHAAGAKLVVDNTFASPILCRPLELGADIVVESISKSINGHSDVMLGSVSCREADWANIPSMVSIWGLASSPFDCWLACRGLVTLHLRAKAAAENAAARSRSSSIEQAEASPTFATPACRRTRSRAGETASSAACTERSSRSTSPADYPRAEKFITAIAEDIPFAPSLGEVSTTLSHPASTSHRNQTPDQQAHWASPAARFDYRSERSRRRRLSEVLTQYWRIEGNVKCGEHRQENRELALMSENPYQSATEGQNCRKRKEAMFPWMLFGGLIGLSLLSIPVSIWSALNVLAQSKICKTIAAICGVVLGLVAMRILANPDTEQPISATGWLATGAITFITTCYSHCLSDVVRGSPDPAHARRRSR